MTIPSDPRLRVIIDTREQAPWGFPEDKVIAVRGTLKTGDYAIEGDSGFAVERKSLNDFLGTISSGWERFQREIERMRSWPARVVIVEGDFAQCCFLYSWEGHIIPPQHVHPNLLPQFVASRIAELTMDGVSVLLCGFAEGACGMAYQILRKRQLQILNGEASSGE